MNGIFEVFVASLVFGASNGLHCAGMCGPLTLVLGGHGSGLLPYHSGRVIAYAVVGLVCGAVGEIFLPNGLGRGVSWVLIALAICLVGLAFGLEHKLRVPFLGRGMQKLMPRLNSLSPQIRSLGVGACTPLLPCGLSMAAYGTAVVSGDAVLGMTTLTGFALGSLPLLLLAQTQMARLRDRFGPRGLIWMSRGAMLIAAGLLLWRGIQTLRDASCCPS